MMDITKIELLEDNILGKSRKAFIVSVREIHPFENGKSNQEKIEGYRIEVVIPDKSYEKISVNLLRKPDITQAVIDEAEEPIVVTFINFKAKIYKDFRNNSYNITCKADSIEIAEFI